MILDKVACIVTWEHQERINEVAAGYEPLLVVTTEDRLHRISKRLSVRLG
jgi:hypothetical protein